MVTKTQRVLVAAAAVALLAAPIAMQAQTKPDFSGVWTLDKAKSDPKFEVPNMQIPDDPATVTIAQTATDLVVDEGAGKATYKLDGSDSSNQAAFGMAQVTKTKWDGSAIVTSGSFDAGPDMGTIEFRNTRTLSEDGKTMTIEAWGKMSMGEGARKLVYTK